MALPTDDQMKAILDDPELRQSYLDAMREGYCTPSDWWMGIDLAQLGSERTGTFVWHRKPWHRRLRERLRAWWNHRVLGKPREVTVEYTQHWELRP